MSFVSVAGPAGNLQALAQPPSGSARAVAVVCHPHPLHGGTLSNKVVHQLARTFNELGAVSVRFNFRGVGDSEGVFDEGRGELDDLLAVVAWARGQWPDLPLWLAGFSFGGFIAIKAASELEPQWLVTVAPAVNYFPAHPATPRTSAWTLIQGMDDDIVPVAAIQAFVAGLAQPPVVDFVAAAGHFFHGRLNDLKQALLDSAPPT